MSLRSNRKPALGQRSTSKNMQRSKPEPAIWSRDTGQQISSYDNCQFNIIWMSNIKDIRCNPRLQDLVLAGWPPCCATSFVIVVVVGPTRPWSIPLAIFTMRKKLHGFLFLCMHVILFLQLWGSAWRPFGPPELRYKYWLLSVHMEIGKDISSFQKRK